MYDSKYNMLLKNERKKQLIKIKNFEQKKLEIYILKYYVYL